MLALVPHCGTNVIGRVLHMMKGQMKRLNNRNAVGKAKFVRFSSSFVGTL
jgi:hypothetical protein